MPHVGPMELVIILVIALLLFGPSRLAGLGAAAGKTIKEFRRSMRDVEEDVSGAKRDVQGALRDIDDNGKPSKTGA
jgi:sec-independent protein translocase protein TatA